MQAAKYVLVCSTSDKFFWILMSFILEWLTQLPINPYGKAKKMAEDIILDFSKNSDMAVMILRYLDHNVYTNKIDLC